MSENPDNQAPAIGTNIAEAYKKLEAEGIARQRIGKGDKAARMRVVVKDIAKTIGKTKLLMSAVYKITKEKMPADKIDRSYFSQAIERTYETERDKDGHVWIMMDKPKAEKTSPSATATAAPIPAPVPEPTPEPEVPQVTTKSKYGKRTQ